jgi:hypothetical protein
MIRPLSLSILICFACVQCAGRFAMVEHGPPRIEWGPSTPPHVRIEAPSPDGNSLTGSAMDQTHDENFKMPPEKKDSLSDKAGMTIVAIVAVGVAVASAIAIPLILANR